MTQSGHYPIATTSFHHQFEAQHPKSSAIHNNAGRLPHLLEQQRTKVGSGDDWLGRECPKTDIAPERYLKRNLWPSLELFSASVT